MTVNGIRQRVVGARSSGVALGFTLIELMVVVAIIATVLIVAGRSLRTNEQDIVTRASNAAVNLMRRAHSNAAGGTNAVIVVVHPFGNPDPDAGLTAGRFDAFTAAGNQCPSVSPTAGVGVGDPNYPCADVSCADQPYESVRIAQDFPNTNPGGNAPFAGDEEDAGIALISHPDASNRMELCFTTLGKVIDRTTGAPFAPDPTDPSMANFINGSAEIWVQFNPVRLSPDGTPIVPRAHIVVPWTGLAGIEP